MTFEDYKQRLVSDLIEEDYIVQRGLMQAGSGEPSQRNQWQTVVTRLCGDPYPAKLIACVLEDGGVSEGCKSDDLRYHLVGELDY